MHFADLGKSLVLESGVEEETWIKKQLPPRSLSASSCRPLSAASERNQRDKPRAGAYYQTPFEAPPPKLTGQTGGFRDGLPVPPRRCSTAPGRIRASPSNAELQAEPEAAPEVTLSKIDIVSCVAASGSGISMKDLPRLSSPSRRIEEAIKALSSRKRKSRQRVEGCRRSKSSAGSDKLLAEQWQSFHERRDSTEANAATRKASCSGLQSSTSTKTSLERSSLTCAVKLPDKLESRVARMTQHFLHLRGLDKPAAAQAGVGRGEESAVDTVFANPRSKLSMRQCVPPARKPYDIEPENLHIVERCWTPEVGYARGCLNAGVNPNIVKFFANPSSKLDFADYLIGDNDLQAFLDALQSPQHVKSQKSKRPLVTNITLSNNKRLSDSMISRFLSSTLQDNALSGPASMGQLKVLTFSDCIGFGIRSFEILCNFLRRGVELRNLEEMDLQGVPVPPTMWLKLCGCLSAPRNLRRLCLARTGCGKHSQEDCRAVAGLIGVWGAQGSCKHLQYLDISGNHFLHIGCAALGEALRNACDEFQEVDLSHNAGLAALHYDSNDFNPIMHVLEALGETTVTKAAFVNCQISFAEDCILEDAVASSEITHLDLGDNPHGEQGLRCLARLLLARRLESMGLLCPRNSPLPPDTVKYDYVDPSAAYRLKLNHPQHRSVLRLLLKRSEQCGGNFSCFSEEVLDGKRLSDGMRNLCTKRIDRGGDDWQVPREGILTFTFEVTRCYKPLDELETVLYRFERSQRVKVDFDGFARLVRLYRSLPDERSQRLLMCAMGRDLVLKLCHLKHFLKTSKDELNFIMVTLLPTLDVQTSRTLLIDLIESCRERSAISMVTQLKKMTSSLLYFNAKHADGHYSLDLSNFTDRRTAQQCMVISQWVRTQNIELRRPDLSEYGNHDCLRHASVSGRKFIYDSINWQLPDEGLLIFDFVLPRLPLNTEDAAPVFVVDQICNQLLNSPCNFQDRLKALRLISHRLVLRPEELVELLHVFPSCAVDYAHCKKQDFYPLVEMYVLLYNRTLYHSKVVSPRILYNSKLLEPEESFEIQRRLGWIHTFDIVNLHCKVSNLGTRHGPMDLATWDGWVVAKAIIAISQTEAHLNFENCYWSEKHALYERGYTFTVPIEWVPDPPRIGKFTCSWHSRVEEVNYKKRRELAAIHFGWTFDSHTVMRRRSDFRRNLRTSRDFA